jgi:hypothetical protein
MSKIKKKETNKETIKDVKSNRKKETKLREVPFKNYIILIVICFATIGLMSLFSILYRRYEMKQMETPVINGVIPEIKKEDIDNYVVENDSFFLYVGSASDNNSRNVEKDLIKYFEKREIKNDTIYLNVTNENDLDNFYKTFNEKYVVNDYSKLKDYPAFIIFSDNKVLDLVQKSENRNLNIGDIDRVLDEYNY